MFRLFVFVLLHLVVADDEAQYRQHYVCVKSESYGLYQHQRYKNKVQPLEYDVFSVHYETLIFL